MCLEPSQIGDSERAFQNSVCSKLSVDLYICIFVSVSLYLYLYICIFVSVSLYLYLYICIFISVSLYLYLYICIFISVSLYIHTYWGNSQQWGTTFWKFYTYHSRSRFQIDHVPVHITHSAEVRKWKRHLSHICWPAKHDWVRRF
jgi:hypothetical protein